MSDASHLATLLRENTVLTALDFSGNAFGSNLGPRYVTVSSSAIT